LATTGCLKPASFISGLYRKEKGSPGGQRVHGRYIKRLFAAERSELKERFDAPPNIFDQFELAATVSVCDRLAAAERDLERIRASASWQWTAPLRAVRDWLAKLGSHLNFLYC
jgi:hypothetical protein